MEIGKQGGTSNRVAATSVNIEAGTGDGYMVILPACCLQPMLLTAFELAHISRSAFVAITGRFCILSQAGSPSGVKMRENRKLPGSHAVRMPTLAEAMLDSLMTPTAATSALTKAALVVFGVCFWPRLPSLKYRFTGTSHWTNSCCFADRHDLWTAPWRHHNGYLSI